MSKYHDVDYEEVNEKSSKKKKKKRSGFGGGFAVIVIFLLLFVGARMLAVYIPAGYVGVVYSMNGGIKEEPLGQGFHLLAPTDKVKEFTVGNEQLILTADEREGSPTDDSFNVSTSDNASIKISFQMSYRFIRDQVTTTYSRFRGMNGEDIVNSRIRTVLKAKISEITTFYSMMDIYSGDRGAINAEITEALNKEFSEAYGIEVLDASIIDVHPDAQLQKTIDDRVTAMQKKQQAEAEQQTIKVENETKVMNANAEAEVKRIEAENAAELQRIQADAEAYANTKVSSSITDELIRMKEAEARLEHGWVTIQGASTVVSK